MFIHTVIISSALLTLPQAPTPPRATPETPRPAAQEPARPDAARKDHPAGVMSADAAFVQKAAEGSQVEIEIAKLAQQKAENADVKAFAAKLESDHTKAYDELKELATKKNVTLPAGRGHNATYAKLEKLSGKAFDQAFVSAMLTDHQKDVRTFERTAANAKDADVKAFATKTLPTLKEHLQQVQDLSKTVGVRKPTS